jgi:hypothetical protein
VIGSGRRGQNGGPGHNDLRGLAKEGVVEPGVGDSGGVAFEESGGTVRRKKSRMERFMVLDDVRRGRYVG